MDVETILNQIRERVVSEENARITGTSVSTKALSSNGSAAGSSQDEALARLSEQLTVTGRAWNRLPPIVSNRRGTLARIELWIKNTCRPLTRWFTWEQVNFNRAVHDALSDAVRILTAEVQELAALRAQLSGEMRREVLTLRSDLDRLNSSHAEYRSDLEARLEKTNDALSRISNMLADLTEESRGGSAQLAQQHSQLAEQTNALREEQRTGASQQAAEFNQRLSELAAELKEEQRVCFRQLSLEASEAAILEDRGRRALDARLEKLEKSLQTRKG